MKTECHNIVVDLFVVLVREDTNTSVLLLYSLQVPVHWCGDPEQCGLSVDCGLR